MAIVYLFLSFVCTSLTNNGLLFVHRQNRKARISYHAATSKKSYISYVVGHVLGGLFFGLFARELFWHTFESQLLYYTALIGVAFEMLQALVPSWRKLKTPHWIFAWGMAGVMSSILLIAPFVIGLEKKAVFALVVAVLTLIINTIIDIKATRDRFWVTQSVYFILFYVNMLILAV